MVAAERLRMPAKPAERPRNEGMTLHRFERTTALVEEALRRGHDQPLDPALRGQVETLLNHDFSRVRIHADQPAAAAAQSLGALAFTVGDHIFFAEGVYQPGTVEGRRLLTHELVHVVQQSSAAPTDAIPLTITQPSDPLEREAVEIADRVELANRSR